MGKEPKRLVKEKNKLVKEPKRLVKELSPNRELILTIVEKEQDIKIPELSERIGITTTAVDKNIKYLKQHKFLERIGGRKDGYWKVIK